MNDGGYGHGELIASESENHLKWHNHGFDRPFDLDLNRIRSVVRLSSASVRKEWNADADVMLESRGRFRIMGRLLAMDEQTVTLEHGILGRVDVSRKNSLTLIGSQEFREAIYLGPQNDNKWQSVQGSGSWTWDSATWSTNDIGSMCASDLALPAQCRIELVLSWDKRPMFIVMLGSNLPSNQENQTDLSCAARLEVWDQQLVLIRETAEVADISMLKQLADDSEVELSIYLDQLSGTTAVQVNNDREIHVLRVPSDLKAPLPYVAIRNLGLSLHLKEIEVHRWDGKMFSPTDPSNTEATRAGEVPSPQAIVGYDRETARLLIRSASGEESTWPFEKATRLSIGIDAPEKTDVTRKSDASETTAINAPTVEVVLQDDTRIRGLCCASNDRQTVVLSVDQFTNPIHVPINHLSALSVYSDTVEKQAESDEPLLGTILSTDLEFHGRLNGDLNPEAPEKLRFSPAGSKSDASILESLSGEFKFATVKVSTRSKSREQHASTPQREPAPQPAGAKEGVGVLLPILNALGFADKPAEARRAGSRRDSSRRDTSSFSPTLTFRSGDVIDTSYIGIDEQGVHFKSPQSALTFVIHEKVDQIYLRNASASTKLSDDRRTRLMTVPRILKKDPPTHLLISQSGDFLRGRLIKLDEEHATIEVRGNIVEIPRPQISQIVWLHTLNWDVRGNNSAPSPNVAADSQATTPVLDKPFRIHLLLGAKHGLSMVPTSIKDGIVYGTNEWLGGVSTELSSVKRLLFGRDLDERIIGLRDESWELSLAKLPRVYREDASDEQSQARLHPLVGSPAPTFVLDALDEKTFRLQDQRGKVIVLDFWASWCGPCMKTMPIVEQVVQEFDDSVKLVAVNIQEIPARVMLSKERLGVECTIVLDRDGQTAAAYQVNAIPQTVIINAEGKVTHVIVGGGPSVIDTLRASIQESRDGAKLPQP
jgi:thiol-disulfide isomerase/thioredoxin